MTHSIVSLALLITLASGSTSLAHPHEAQSPADFATQLSAAFQNAAENIKPSVVRIGTAEVVPHTTGYHWRTGVPFIEGTGSGLIISADGYIATNDHVVADADLHCLVHCEAFSCKWELALLALGVGEAVRRVDAAKAILSASPRMKGYMESLLLLHEVETCELHFWRNA